ncbi:MAG TPA: hypothetical protein HPP76_08075 [Desulfuromonadales bacterium]|nr:hypothetical protein [Desulfuromonadales bacterium]
MTEEGARSFLIISEEEGLFALDLKHVFKVCEPPRIWPVPCAPLYCRGAAHINGSICAVMELAELVECRRSSNLQKMVVLHPGTISLALLVGQATKIVRDVDVIFRESPDDPATQLLDLPEGTACLIDVSVLVQNVEKCFRLP